MNSNTESDTSSVEILKALTTHLASPLDQRTPQISPLTNHITSTRPQSADDNETANQLGIEKPAFITSDSDCNVITI